MTKHPPVGRRIADFESQDTTPSTVVLSANVQLVCARIWASKLLHYASVIPLFSILDVRPKSQSDTCAFSLPLQVPDYIGILHVGRPC